MKNIDLDELRAFTHVTLRESILLFELQEMTLKDHLICISVLNDIIEHDGEMSLYKDTWVFG